MPEQNVAAAKTSAKMEAVIRRRSRPHLEPDERKALALRKEIQTVELAEARCREAAQEHAEKAEQWAGRKSELAEQLAALSEDAQDRARQIVGD